jgi:rsbT co-antagonist protein RsbR
MSQMKSSSVLEMMDFLFEQNPDGICIARPDGTLELNATARALFVGTEATIGREEWVASDILFLPDQVTPHPADTLPIARALRGETVRDYEIFTRGPHAPEGMWISVHAMPFAQGGAISTFRDVTERKRLEKEIADRNEDLRAHASENARLIERLRLSLDELSTPVLEVWDDVLALPVVGVVDSLRSAQMAERLLAEVVNRRSKHVIVDLTGVEVVDTSTADRVVKLARAVRLLGASCVISGIQPEVARTLTELGVEFTGLATRRNLKRALEHCISGTQGGARP